MQIGPGASLPLFIGLGMVPACWQLPSRRHGVLGWPSSLRMGPRFRMPAVLPSGSAEADYGLLAPPAPSPAPPPPLHAPACLYVPSDTFNLDKTTFKYNEDIVVTVTQSAGATTSDWIAIGYKPTVAPPEGMPTWFFVCQSQNVCASSVSSGSITFSSATVAGAWLLVVGDYYGGHLDNNGIAPIATTPATPTTFTVIPGVALVRLVLAALHHSTSLYNPVQFPTTLNNCLQPSTTPYNPLHPLQPSTIPYNPRQPAQLQPSTTPYNPLKTLYKSLQPSTTACNPVQLPTTLDKSLQGHCTHRAKVSYAALYRRCFLRHCRFKDTVLWYPPKKQPNTKTLCQPPPPPPVAPGTCNYILPSTTYFCMLLRP